MSPKVPCEHVLPSALLAAAVTSPASDDHHDAVASPAATAMEGRGSGAGNRCRSRHAKRLEEEYRKLQAVVPSVRQQRRAKRIQIINEAVKYIDKLHADLLHKLLQGRMTGVNDLTRKSGSRPPLARQVGTLDARLAHVPAA